MTHHVLLDNVAHKDLRIDRRFTPGAGFDFNVARVFPVELGYLQAEYPIFFLKNPDNGHFETVALLGFEDGENLYLGGDRWLARYLPLSVERGPFLIGFQEQDDQGVPEKVPVITVDMDHPSVNTTSGEPVFLPEGGQSPLLERVDTVLATIHEGREASETLSRILVGLDLLEPFTLDVRFDEGERHTVNGLYRVNEDRLDALDGGALETLAGAGHLRSVFMILASLPNIENLIQWKNRQRSASR